MYVAVIDGHDQTVFIYVKATMDWPMATPSGYALFLDGKATRHHCWIHELTGNANREVQCRHEEGVERVGQVPQGTKHSLDLPHIESWLTHLSVSGKRKGAQEG